MGWRRLARHPKEEGGGLPFGGAGAGVGLLGGGPCRRGCAAAAGAVHHQTWQVANASALERTPVWQGGGGCHPFSPPPPFLEQRNGGPRTCTGPQ